MNKRRLYESIMRNVSKTVKRALMENVSTNKSYHPETKEELEDDIMDCLENNLSLNVIDVSGIDDFIELFTYDKYSPDEYKYMLGKYINDKGITSIDISEWDINPNAIVDGMFAGSTLEEVILPNTLTNIGDGMFFDCSGLMSVVIPYSVTSIGKGAFEYCRHLMRVRIPDLVKTIGYQAFAYCSALTSVTIPNSVTSIDKGAFYYCSGLTSVTIPDSVTHIGDYAFTDCPNLTIYVNNVAKFKNYREICKASQIKPIRECRNIRYRR